MKIRILVVDDSPFIYKAIARILPEDDYEICGSGKNGQEGVELYQRLKPDVVTMDITMPIMDGLAAAREILRRDPKAKIIMLSAMGDEEIVQEAKTAGIKMILKKPFKAPDMLAALSKVYALDNSDAEDAAQQDDNYLEYFRTALKDTLQDMAGLECSFGETELQQGILESEGLAVILGIAGKMTGRVILDTSREVACRLCGMMNGEEYGLEDDFVLFSLAEFLNILSGNATTNINNSHRGLNLRLAPPSVFVGRRLNINSPKVKAHMIRMETAAGAINLSVGFEGS
ncbi:MAG: response regulator [Thermacetogeniaceae bacterium]|jgi:CheY-specific phosphatase CheX/CheY-like chemotaxis protein